jgi:predicted PurR-regulated permease PerM
MGNHQITVFFLLAAILGLGLYTVQPFLIPLAWAAILAYVTMPMYNRVLRLIGEKPSVAAAISTLLLVLTIIVPVSLFLIRLQGEVFEAYREMSTKVANGAPHLPAAIVSIPIVGQALQEAVTNLWTNPEVRKEHLNQWLGPWTRELAGILGKIGTTALQFAISVITIFFFYRDGHIVVNQVQRGLRKLVGSFADDYVNAIAETTRAVVFGLMLSAIAQGIIAGIGYAFLGLKMPILLALLTTFTALVPFLGTVAVWGPIGVWLLFTEQKTIGIELLVWGTFIVNPTDNILKPLLISGATDIPLIIVLLGVMGGLIAFGLVGLFLGPLILAILLAIWREWLEEDSRGATPADERRDG